VGETKANHEVEKTFTGGELGGDGNASLEKPPALRKEVTYE